MSRLNLEDSSIRRPRELSPQYAITVIKILGPVRIPSDGPTIWFLDADGGDKSVFLPEFAPFGGQLYYVCNSGDAGNLNLFDSNGVVQAVVEPGRNAVLWSSTNKWWFLVGGTGGILVGASTKPPEILGAGLLNDPIRFGGIQSDPEFFIGNGTVANPLTLTASGGVIVQDDPPNTRQGRLWYESDTGIFWLWYDDGSSGQWVQMNGAPNSSGGNGGGGEGGPFQPLDAELTALAALNSAADKLPYFTGSQIAGLADFTAAARTLLAQTTTGAMLLQLGGQPVDQELTAIAGTTSAANMLPYFTGAGTASTTTLSPFMRTVLDDVDAATLRGTIGAQPLDGDLTAISALAGTNTIYYRSGVDTWSPVTFSGLTFTGGVLTAPPPGGNVSNSGTPTVGQYAKWVTATTIQGVAPATVLSDIGAQPSDGDLTALAGLTGTDVLYYRSGTNAWSPVTYAGGISFAGGVLTGSGGGGGGNVFNSGTPAVGELAEWVNATTIKGITKASLGFAPLASPTFTGVPAAPTAAPGTNTTQVATTAFVQAAGFAPLASPTFTGDPKAPTPATSDNDTSIATTAMVQAVKATLVGTASTGFDTLGEIESYIVANITPVLPLKADIASPTFTGDPKAPTPSAGDSDTSIATTAFVQNAIGTSVAGYLPLTGGTLTGPLAINMIGAQLILNKTLNTQATILTTVGGLNRWVISPGEGTTESGGNAGSNFAIHRYADTANTLLGTPLTISRATGVVSMPSADLGTASVGVTQALTDSSTKLATTAFVQGCLAKLPVIRVFTTGNGTFVPTSGAKYLDVEAVGGGQGGSNGDSTGGGVGFHTTFGPLTACGGGTGEAGVGELKINGQYPLNNGNVADGSTWASGGTGGHSKFGWGGTGSYGSPGGDGQGYGSGGGGGGRNSPTASAAGPGGQAGQYVRGILAATNHSWTIGVGGTGQGTIGNAQKGGNGAPGVVIVTEHF